MHKFPGITWENGEGYILLWASVPYSREGGSLSMDSKSNPGPRKIRGAGLGSGLSGSWVKGAGVGRKKESWTIRGR